MLSAGGRFSTSGSRHILGIPCALLLSSVIAAIAALYRAILAALRTMGTAFDARGAAWLDRRFEKAGHEPRNYPSLTHGGASSICREAGIRSDPRGILYRNRRSAGSRTYFSGHSVGGGRQREGRWLALLCSSARIYLRHSQWLSWRGTRATGVFSVRQLQARGVSGGVQLALGRGGFPRSNLPS